MSISILIIAHNEEKHIEKCLDSVVKQSLQADEIVVIVHNSTDKTLDIARSFSDVKVLELHSNETGPIPAREYGFQKVGGDIIACLDGDSHVVESWLMELVKPFSNHRVNSVSGYPILLGNFWTSFFFFLLGLPILRHVFAFYFWGGNFACRRASYEEAGGMKKCREIGELLQLHYPAEDVILSFLLQKYGTIHFARKAISYAAPGKFFGNENRGKKQRSDFRKILQYFQANK